MAHVAPIYPNFARGEVSPLMFGRIDIEQYPTCLDKCRNVYIRPYGCATRLAGTEYVANAKNNGKARLLKFVFSATDSYIIECGAGYFRFYQNGAPVMSNGSVYEVVNDYYEDQLDSIQYVQLDDVIKLTCLPHNNDNSTARPKELIRNASDNWTFRDVTFVETPYLDQNTSNITMKASATTGNDITITASSAYFNADMVGANMWIGTKVTDSETNKDVQGYVQFIPNNNNSSTVMHAKVMATLSGTTATKLWGEGAFSDYRGYPSVVALFDGRLYYARTPYQPRNVYGSKPYSYETFTPAVDNEDDAGINIALATNANGDGSDIKWMIGASFLLCGTYGGEFVIRGAGDGAVTATDISARQRTNWGGEPVQPIVAGTFVHFLQRNGNKLRQFQYDYFYDAYKAVDVSIFSEHLLESPIKQMALQKNPDSIIYLMREDGKVVILTLEQDQSVQAWSLLEELGAEVESIQTIPSYDGNYDEVYMIMKRKTLETILSYECSNPSLTITDTYSDTKEEEGTIILDLVYNGDNDVWTTDSSSALNTKLTVTSSNQSLNPTTSYYGTKTQTGTITEVLEYQNSGYALSNLVPQGTPVFDSATGIASFGNNTNVAYYRLGNAAQSLQANRTYIFKITTGDNVSSEQKILGFTHNSTSPTNWVYISGSKIRTIASNGSTVSRNRNYWIKLSYYYNSSSSYGTKVYISSNGTSYSQLADLTSCRLFCIDSNSSYNKFKGTVDFVNSTVDDTAFADSSLLWVSQTTGNVVNIQNNNYAISLATTPAIGDTLTCEWNTISGYVKLSDYDLAVVGTPEDEDTITLTYTTAMTGTSRHVERMLNPITPENQNDWWYVRSGLKYDGYQITKGISLSLTANSGTVTATASSSVFNSGMVGNRIRFKDADYNVLGEGTITGYTSGTSVTLAITTEFESATITGGEWGISANTVSGLEHLNGQEVQIYADNKEQAKKTVTGGSIDVDDAFIIVVGLPYTSYITTMPLEAGSQNGTAVGKRKRISEMAIRVWNTLGVRVGRDLDNLYDTIYQQQEPYTGVIPNIKYNQGWVWDANITIEQSRPYAMNILSIAPIVTEVDK